MSALAEHVSRNLRRYRIAADLTQAKLALNAGVTVETVARLERVVRGAKSANANPSLETLERLATSLGLEVSDLLEGGKVRAVSEGVAARKLRAIERVLEGG